MPFFLGVIHEFAEHVGETMNLWDKMHALVCTGVLPRLRRPICERALPFREIGGFIWGYATRQFGALKIIKLSIPTLHSTPIGRGWAEPQNKIAYFSQAQSTSANRAAQPRRTAVENLRRFLCGIFLFDVPDKLFEVLARYKPNNS
jgi:hypothetical protein